MAKKRVPGTVSYYTYSHNIETCLRNGSYVRRDKDGTLVHYINGDCMGVVKRMPGGMTEVDAAFAKNLLPKCCK